jgi:AcrR family transcriptional regulator
MSGGIHNTLNMKEIIIKNPAQARSKAKFSAILNALPQVFGRIGYARLTTEKIALEAGVSIGSLYNYFNCKEAVVAAYLDRELNEALDAVLTAARDQLCTQADFLHKVVDISVDFDFRHAKFLKALLQSSPELAFCAVAPESQQTAIEIMSNLQCRESYRFRERDMDVAAFTLTNIFWGFRYRLAILPPDNISMIAIKRELAEIIQSYLFYP